MSARRLDLDALPKPVKTGLVLGGYALALVAALGVAWLRYLLTDNADRAASGGMYAFGDFLLFLFVAAAGSTIPTALALFFLRGTKWFWAMVALVVLACVPLAFPGWLIVHALLHGPR